VTEEERKTSERCSGEGNWIQRETHTMIKVGSFLDKFKLLEMYIQNRFKSLELA
jgi:hypothetical protein